MGTAAGLSGEESRAQEESEGLFGSPAAMAIAALGPRLCVPVFRRVCLFGIPFSMLNEPWGKMAQCKLKKALLA